MRQMTLNHQEFYNAIESIDSKLSFDEIQIHQRPMIAFMEFTKLFNIKESIEIVNYDNFPNNDFSNKYIPSHINEWYEKRYGDRIKVHPGPGNYLIVIKAEPWKVVLPMCYGKVNFFIDSNLLKRELSPAELNWQKMASVNILCHIENFTQDMASSLMIDEKKYIIREYLLGLNIMQTIQGMTNDSLIRQAKNDYDMALDNMFLKLPNYANAKWSILQFSEKIIKSFMNASGISFKYTHDLKKLSKQMESLGKYIPNTLIESIQCSPGVRYGEIVVGKNEAIEAIKSSINLFNILYESTAYKIEK
jgi:HEPN domain-containing protein